MAAVFAVMVIALAAAGCAREKPKPRLVYQERPVELLYSTGAAKLDEKRWGEAIDYFREVERQHPYSEWSRRAILMTAYAHYQANAYAAAIEDADRFISLYPGNQSTSYAYYLKAVCYFEQIVDVGRDQASTEQALQALNDVIARYPRSEYAADARLKIDMVRDQLAGKEMTIGRYYLRQGQTLAAIGRFRTVVDKYQTTSHTPEALYRLVEAYMTVGLLGEAKRNGAVLGYNYPDDAWYGDAYKLLTSKGLQPAIEPRTPGSKKSFLQRLTRDKGATLAPPASDSSTDTAAPDQTSATLQAPPADAAPAAPPPPKAKRKSLLDKILRR
ncbi:outer membrane protein assembly factor BamD [Caulobacter ginsengisoli]|uniref:Outer membrane protein assembly factor BamD n=1 Tax=Caulobacter ginsengisoli TaxID=400775 RepID=A0ABU0IJU9_9CAUL|nr:outer membrane protein assembly factor BamD [Caulobacter ginsengisoli]MDQ0462278.1 outer membrane protein assembly factor BamD [Caulobacter ginsengisoli]